MPFSLIGAWRSQRRRAFWTFRSCSSPTRTVDTFDDEWCRTVLIKRSKHERKTAAAIPFPGVVQFVAGTTTEATTVRLHGFKWEGCGYFASPPGAWDSRRLSHFIFWCPWDSQELSQFSFWCLGTREDSVRSAFGTLETHEDSVISAPGALWSQHCLF